MMKLDMFLQALSIWTLMLYAVPIHNHNDINANLAQ